MKNIKFWTILGVLSLSITCSIAYGSNSNATSGLQSKGKLVYQDPTSQQEVIMDANDHTILKGSIDANSVEIMSLKQFMEEQTNKNTEFEQDIQELNDNMGGVQFGINGEGKRCYLEADGSLVPFNGKFPYIVSANPKAYCNREWNYVRMTPIIVVNPDGCKSFTLRKLSATSAHTSTPLYKIDSIDNGTYVMDENDNYVITPTDPEENVTIYYKSGNHNNAGADYMEFTILEWEYFE